MISKLSDKENKSIALHFSEMTQNPFVAKQHLSTAQTVIHSQGQIEARGWSVVTGFDGQAEAEQFLAHFGDLTPQYDGTLRYEVKAKPEFETFQYSQSSNTIQPHTEAPVFAPPPRYLALYCHYQARCGGGYTDFADGLEFIDSLPTDLKAVAAQTPIDFSGSRLPSGEKSLVVSTPMLSQGKNNKPIFRFSYNVFFYDDLHPVIESAGGREADHGNQYLKTLAQLGFDFFHQNQSKVLIPPNGLLIWDNHRMLHARSQYEDKGRHLTRFWINQ